MVGTPKQGVRLNRDTDVIRQLPCSRVPLYISLPTIQALLSPNALGSETVLTLVFGP